MTRPHEPDESRDRRAAMLRYCFGRPPEARIRLLVRSAQTRQLRWIELRSLRALNAP